MADGVRADQYVIASGFKIDITGGPDPQGPDGSWKVVQGGSLTFDVVSGASTGQDQFMQGSLGQKQWQNLNVTGPVTSSRKDMLQWVADMKDGKSDKLRRNVTVTMVNKDGTDGIAYNFLNCFLESYQLTDLSGDNASECFESISINVGRSDMFDK
jgi:phage tail-like protein